jgi:hypothetical protein
LVVAFAVLSVTTTPFLVVLRSMFQGAKKMTIDLVSTLGVTEKSCNRPRDFGGESQGSPKEFFFLEGNLEGKH